MATPYEFRTQNLPSIEDHIDEYDYYDSESEIDFGAEHHAVISARLDAAHEAVMAMLREAEEQLAHRDDPFDAPYEDVQDLTASAGAAKPANQPPTSDQVGNIAEDLSALHITPVIAPTSPDADRRRRAATVRRLAVMRRARRMAVDLTAEMEELSRDDDSVDSYNTTDIDSDLLHGVPQRASGADHSGDIEPSTAAGADRPQGSQVLAFTLLGPEKFHHRFRPRLSGWPTSAVPMPELIPAELIPRSVPTGLVALPSAASDEEGLNLLCRAASHAREIDGHGAFGDEMDLSEG